MAEYDLTKPAGSITRTIAALRGKCERVSSWTPVPVTILVRIDVVRALCDAAEASLRADKREQKMREELEAVTVAASDPRINNTMSLEEWVREKAGLRVPPREPTLRMMDAARDYLPMGIWPGSLLIRGLWRAMCDAAPINEGGQDAETGTMDVEPRPVPPSPDHALLLRPFNNVVPPAPDGATDDRYCWHAWKYDARNAGCVVKCGKPRAPKPEVAPAAPAPASRFGDVTVVDGVAGAGGASAGGTAGPPWSGDGGTWPYTPTPAAPAPDADGLAARFPTLARIARSTGTVGYQQPDLNAELAPAYELLAAQAAQIADLSAQLAEAQTLIAAHKIRPRGKSDSPAIFNAVQRAERAERAEAECERLISERDGARDESAARQHEVNAYRAECERLRAALTTLTDFAVRLRTMSDEELEAWKRAAIDAARGGTKA